MVVAEGLLADGEVVTPEWMMSELLEMSKQIRNIYPCSLCGWCCKTCNPQVEVSLQNRIRSMTSEGDWESSTHLKVPCVFLGDKECKIYDYRPRMCKIFPLGTVLINGIFHVRIHSIEICDIAKNLNRNLSNYCLNNVRGYLVESNPVVPKGMTICNAFMFDVIKAFINLKEE